MKYRSTWWQKMIKRHGSVEAVKQHMSEIGTKGGGVPNKKRGFAVMDKTMHREISARGGRISRRAKNY